MNLVETVAPISIENLKKYFTDKTTFFVINYKDSALKGAKLLTYLSNLDIPCDISMTGCSEEECYSLLKDYLEATVIVTVPSLEYFTIDIIKQFKQIKPVFDSDFIAQNKDTLSRWCQKIESLTLYNMMIVDETSFKEYVKSFPEDSDDTLVGVNFISLIKNPSLYEILGYIDKSSLRYFVHYFNDYMFKGKNLYSYWANENNPLFLLTYSIANGSVTPEEYVQAKKQTIEELANATSV